MEWGLGANDACRDENKHGGVFTLLVLQTAAHSAPTRMFAPQLEATQEIRHLSAPSSADTAMPLAPTRGAASTCKDQPPHARADTSFRAWHSFFRTV